MTIRAFTVYTFPVPFRLTFRHASAARSRAENIIVAAHADDGTTGYGEGCPRDYVTGETVATCHAFIARHRESLAHDVRSVADLQHWIAKHETDIDRNPAAFCALELAILDLLGKRAGRPLESLFGLPPLAPPVRYSAVLGDNPRWLFWLQAQRYWHNGFRDYKIKLSGERSRDHAKLRLFAGRRRAATRIRADANNAWTDADACAAFLGGLPRMPAAIEEPLAAGDLDGCRSVAAACGVRIILDESLLSARQLAGLDDGHRWIANIRVSKMGGLIRSLTLLDRARARGVGIIVGAHVGETGILTRAGLTLARAAGDGLHALEGGFGTHLLRHDLTVPSLRFGAGGVLDPIRFGLPQGAGLGLAVDAEGLRLPDRTGAPDEPLR
jgi:L-alanine-DL-glutamate epimerase-like enolase superfamily enzyme